MWESGLNVERFAGIERTIALVVGEVLISFVRISTKLNEIEKWK